MSSSNTDELVFFNWKQLLIIDGNTVTSPDELVLFNWKQLLIIDENAVTSPVLDV